MIYAYIKTQHYPRIIFDYFQLKVKIEIQYNFRIQYKDLVVYFVSLNMCYQTYPVSGARVGKRGRHELMTAFVCMAGSSVA